MACTKIELEDTNIKHEDIEPTKGIPPFEQILDDSGQSGHAEACIEDPPPEFVEAYQCLEDDTLVGLAGAAAPKTPKAFNDFRFDPKYQSKPHRETVANYVLQLCRNKGQLSPAGYQAVQNMLKSLFRMECLTPDIDRDYQYTWILKTIMGESVAKGNLATKPYAFPQLLAEQASIVLDHFQEDLNIGIAIDASPSPASPALPSTDKKASKNSSTRKRKAEDASTDEATISKPFDMGNPTIAVMMHNLHRSNGGIRIIDRRLKRDHNRFGHNGLNVGDWWPYHACALRDGAHGSSMGGIAGTARDGAKSVVIAGGYEGMDKDEGNIIFYSGSNSHENTDPNTPHISNGTKSLQRAMLDNRNIRVLRNAKGDSKYAPSVGIRYDGLYKIVKEEQRFNAKGGAYLRFKLVRQEGQPPIDLSRPDHKEKKAFAVLKQSV